MKTALTLLAALLFAPLTASQAAEAPKPNIVFILADDLGWKDLGCQGSTFYQTPNIDRLAAGGMRFTDAYAACAVCSPTRAAILTGKYPARIHFTHILGGEKASPNRKLKTADWIQDLPLEEVTFAEALKAAGYATGHFGKWHVGGAGFTPDKQGFDVTMDATRAKNRQDKNVTQLTDAAIAFMRSHAKEPFLAYVCHHTVHVPYEADEALTAAYRAKAPATGQNHPKMAAMIETLDQSVRRVLQTLDELGLAQNTVVISMDLYPTLLDMAGLPARPSQHRDGLSLAPLLRGTGTLDRAALYWHLPHYHSKVAAPMGSLRAGDWKLIEFFEDNRVELYNLENDIGEKQNLAAKEPEKAASLLKQLHHWRTEVNASMPSQKPDLRSIHETFDTDLHGQLPRPQSGELRGWLPEGEVSAFFPDGAKIIQHATGGKRGACFQGTFELPSQPRRAVLAVAAWGIAAAHLNDTLVGEVNQPNVEHVPAFTEVAAWLRPGANILQLRTCGGNKVYAQLRIELADGTFMDVCTDETWQWRAAPASGWPRGPLPPDNWRPASVFDDYYGTAGKAITWNRRFALMPRKLLRETMEHAADSLRTPQPGDESAAPSQFRGTYLRPEYAARYQGFVRLDPRTGQVVDATGKIKHLLFVVYNQKTAKDPFVLRFTEWDFGQLEKDLALMEQAEVHVYLRFLGWHDLLDGEGRWNRCEKQPAGAGLPHFDFNFQILDHFLDRCQAHGRHVVIEGDHHWSASWEMLPPPYHHRYYLYPEVAEVNALAHRKILARYAQRPCVAGYMIGEEDIQMDRDLDNGHLRQAFAEYLRQRYHTLDALKAAWGAGYDYTDRSLLRPTPRKLDAWNLPDCEEIVSTPAYPLVSSPWAGLSRWQDVPMPEWPLFRAATSPYAELASFPALNTFTPNDPVWIDYNAFREDVLYLAHVNLWAAVVRPAAPNQWLFHCNAQDFTAHWMFPMCHRRAELDFDVISTGSHDTGKELSKCTPAHRMRKYFANVAAYRPYVPAAGSRAVAIAAGEGEGGAHDNEQEILNYHRAQTFELLGHGGAFEQAYRWTHLSGAMASPEAQPHLSKALQWMGEFYRAVDGVPFSLHRPVDVLIVGNNNLARSNRGGRDIGNIMAVSDSLGQLNIEFDIAMDLDLAYGKRRRKIDIGSYRMLVLPCIDSDYPETVWQVLDSWLSDPAYRGRRTLVLGHIGLRTPYLTPTKQFHPTLAEWLGFTNCAGEVTLENANALAWTPVAPGNTARNITINFGSRDLSPVGTFRDGRPLLATAHGEVVAAAFAHAGNAIYAFGFPLGLAYDLPWGIPAPQTPHDTMGTVFEDLATAAGIPRPVRSPHNLRVAISDDQSIIMIQERFGIATTDLCRLKVPAGAIYEGCETVPQADGSVLLRAEVKPYEGLFFRRKPAP